MSKTLICIPCMDMVHTAFMQSLLGLKIVGEASCSIKTSSLIYDARNGLTKEAVEGGYDNCRVQVWRNKKTGALSVGWWER